MGSSCCKPVREWIGFDVIPKSGRLYFLPFRDAKLVLKICPRWIFNSSCHYAIKEDMVDKAEELKGENQSIYIDVAVQEAIINAAHQITIEEETELSKLDEKIVKIEKNLKKPELSLFVDKLNKIEENL